MSHGGLEAKCHFWGAQRLPSSSCLCAGASSILIHIGHYGNAQAYEQFSQGNEMCTAGVDPRIPSASGAALQRSMLAPTLVLLQCHVTVCLKSCPSGFDHIIMVK